MNSNVIYNHKKFEQIKNKYIKNKIYYSPQFKTETEIKMKDMIRIKEWLLFF